MDITLTERKAEVIGQLREYIQLVDLGDWETLAMVCDMGDIPELLQNLVVDNLK